jgi:hypothetical protein
VVQGGSRHPGTILAPGRRVGRADGGAPAPDQPEAARTDPASTGWRMTPLTPQLIERVRVLRAAGLSLRQIASTCGCGLATAWKAAAMPATPPPRPLFYEHSPGPGACAWPISDARPWRFCAADHEPGGVYCATHRRMATGTRVREAAV